MNQGGVGNKIIPAFFNCDLKFGTLFKPSLSGFAGNWNWKSLSYN